jgi:hypothetical protein
MPLVWIGKVNRRVERHGAIVPLDDDEAAAARAARRDDVETIASKLELIVNGAGVPLRPVRLGQRVRRAKHCSLSTSSPPQGDVPNFSLDFVPKDDRDSSYLATLAAAVGADVDKVPSDREFENQASRDECPDLDPVSIAYRRTSTRPHADRLADLVRRLTGGEAPLSLAVDPTIRKRRPRTPF